MRRHPRTPDEIRVKEILEKAGFKNITFFSYTAQSHSVQIGEMKEISDNALVEIVEIYPNAYKHWNDDKPNRRHSIELN